MAEANNQYFGNLTYKECAQLQTDLQNKNTLADEAKATNAFKADLSSIGIKDTDLFTYTEEELDKFLYTFWFNTRMRDGLHYSTSSMETMRYGLSRALQRYGHNYDITKRESISFLKSIDAYEDSQKSASRMDSAMSKVTKKSLLIVNMNHILAIFIQIQKILKNTSQSKFY